MRALNIPYIGVKLESIHSILKILSESESNLDFIEYYKEIGKSTKTATEYLASLRNLNLAKKDSSGDTILTRAGKYLLEDSMNSLYKNLLNHCLRQFPDLKLILKIASEKKVDSLPLLISELSNNGFYIQRKQTLSSFYKLFREGNKTASGINRLPSFTNKSEDLEYNQFYKLLKKLSSNSTNKKMAIPELHAQMQNKYTISKEKFIEYLSVLKTETKAKFYEINPKILTDISQVYTIGNKVYFYLELL